MAGFSGDSTHLELVKKGATAINEWRKKHPDNILHLRGADLRDPALGDLFSVDAALADADLCGADLRYVNLRGVYLARTNLAGANLRGADLRYANLTDADLRGAYLARANLARANLARADLASADLTRADLTRAHLAGAYLAGAYLAGANLAGANLAGANLAGANLANAVLHRANFNQTNLTDTNFTGATLGNNNFSYTDLSAAIRLETCGHSCPSTVDVNVLRIANKLPRAFLQGIGLPDDMIDYLPDFFESAINFYTLFISYSTKDEEFANQLYHDLQGQGVRCWYSPKDIKGGEHLHKQIETAIHLQDRVLLILSENSMNSKWVITELTAAFEKKEKEKRQVLFPIRLVSFDVIKKWRLFDSDFGTDLAKMVREYFIQDFSNTNQYQENLARLIRDLRAKETP